MMTTSIVVWSGQLVSVVGSGLTSFGLGVWIYQRTGSATRFALVGLFAVLPKIALSPLAGALADRWNRRRAMVLGDDRRANGSAQEPASGYIESGLGGIETGVSHIAQHLSGAPEIGRMSLVPRFAAGDKQDSDFVCHVHGQAGVWVADGDGNRRVGWLDLDRQRLAAQQRVGAERLELPSLDHLLQETVRRDVARQAARAVERDRRHARVDGERGIPQNPPCFGTLGSQPWIPAGNGHHVFRLRCAHSVSSSRTVTV
jgi:hypothetical protein